MARKRIRKVEYRRKSSGKTDYKKRLTLLLSHKPRLVIRRSLNNILIQIVEFNSKGDKIIVSAHSNELKKQGWDSNKNNTPSAYLVGLIAGKKALSKKIKEAVLDIGLNNSVKGSKLYAAVKGARDAGVQISCSEKVFPKEERICGKHIEEYGKKINNPKLQNITQKFETTKKKIMENQ